jgi:hemerythrin superfamily protein
MSMPDPVLSPADPGDTEALRQEAARSRAEVARTVEQLADRVRPTRLVRPAMVVPVVAGVVAGLGVWVSLARTRMMRQIAWLGGIGAGTLAFATARRGMGRDSVRRPWTALDLLDQPDVIDVLLAEHRRIMAAFDAVRDADEDERLDAFATLVDVLRRHERAEQSVVHPAVRDMTDEATAMTQARVDEEAAAEEMLASLIANGVDDPNFDAGLARLQQMVRDHAEHEESQEFPLLRGQLPADQLRRMAGQVRRNP